jgi:4'-phosphopantetheinyl transferase
VIPDPDGNEGREGQQRSAPVVDIWRVGLHQYSPALQALNALLCSDDRVRRDHFATIAQRNAFTVAHGATILILAAATGRDPRDLLIEHAPCSGCGEPHGKPMLGGDASGVFFNIAHSSELALVAVSTEEVGIDVEDQLSAADLEADECWLSQTESERLTWVSLAERQAELLRTWVRKEAYLKGDGTGLNTDPQTITLVRKHSGWGRSGGDELKCGWHVFDLDLGPGSVGALAIRHSRPMLEFRNWDFVGWQHASGRVNRAKEQPPAVQEVGEQKNDSDRCQSGITGSLHCAGPVHHD